MQTAPRSFRASLSGITAPPVAALGPGTRPCLRAVPVFQAGRHCRESSPASERRRAMSSFPCLFLAFISLESLPVRMRAFGENKHQARPCLDSSAESAGPLRVYPRGLGALAEHHQPSCQPLEVTQGAPPRGRPPAEGARGKPPVDFSRSKRRPWVRDQIKALPSADPPKATGISSCRI